MKEINSVHNPTIKSLRLLSKPRERHQAGLFLADGLKMTEEALQAGKARLILVQSDLAAEYGGLLAEAEKAGTECILTSQAVIGAVCSASTPQGICCAAALPEQPERLTGDLLVALDGVQDPGNVGTILRTADAAGYSGALLGEGCAEPFGAKTLRATMGSVFRVPMRLSRDLPGELMKLRDRGYSILSTELGGEDFFEQSPRTRSVLIIGNEGNGVSQAVRACATHHLALPMRGGAESLNAAVAAGIMIYELSRRLKGEKENA